MLLLMLLNWMFSFTLLFISHPLTIGVILLINTILISLISGMFYLNFWFSYILFLIMISGLLIMFIYMTSVASNEKFTINKYSLLMILFLSCLMVTSTISDKFFYTMKPMNTNTMMLNEFIKNTHMSKFFTSPNMSLLLFLMIYLLLTLMMVAKITDKKMGPLRQKK
uniref:NADH dehydrogenase subunit 6 n=1 Tax=Scolytoplatypus skyliuae TaxID=2894163 RepID=UPI0023AACE68|nr:NADH dehydrogenase subunit 6 [Scolytoplatypus skyliuae]WCB99758.1 NADH dehydrogenase subunit 6 [Scolytoplatypus skyliuae]